MELKLNTPYLKKLKKNRLGLCHYLDDTDDNDLLNDKRTVLLDKINNIDNKVKDLFDKKYPKLIENIKQYMAPVITTPNEDNMEEINDWWSI